MVFSKAKFAAYKGTQPVEKKHTLMLVDDEPSNIATLSSMFSDKYQLITAHDGLEAFEMLTEKIPPGTVSLIISDQRMPRLTGTELFVRLLEIMPKTIRILLTGYTDVSAILESINRAQIYKFVVKPFDREELLLTVARAIEAFELRAEVEAYHRNLEEKIAERTQELERKNQEVLQTQKQMFQQQKMASTGILAAGIAHELKNPLNFVNNFASLSADLCRELKEGLSAFQHQLPPSSWQSFSESLQDLTQNADLIKLHGNRANRIVQSMMNLSRNDAGHIQPTDIHDLITEFVALAQNGLQAKGQSGEVVVDKEFDPKITLVPVMSQSLSRVILNLTTNALESVLAKKDRSGSDYTPMIKVSTQKKDHELVVHFWDNGEGIAKENLEHIFNPFFTLRPAGSGNIGLGLSVCYDIIVREHHGKIEVESTLGSETTLSIRIPYQELDQD